MIKTAEFNVKQHAGLTVIIFIIAVLRSSHLYIFNNIPIEKLNNL